MLRSTALLLLCVAASALRPHIRAGHPPAAAPRARSPLLLDLPKLPLRRVGSLGVRELTEENEMLKQENLLLKQENEELKEAAENATAEMLRIETIARIARRGLLDNIATVNAIILSVIAIGIGYELLGTDIRAVAALYYFDLGPDLYPGFARSAIALDLFLRLPGELLHSVAAA